MKYHYINIMNIHELHHRYIDYTVTQQKIEKKNNRLKVPSDLVVNVHNRSIFLFGLRDKFLCLHEIIWNPNYSQLVLEKSHEISIFSNQIRWILHFLSILLSEAMNAPCLPGQGATSSRSLPPAPWKLGRRRSRRRSKGSWLFMRITIITIISYIYIYIYVCI